MQIEPARTRSGDDTRKRILDVALEVLGKHPEAGMAEIAAAAGVVRRTVYGHFPTRNDLVLTLAQRAVDEMASVLAEANAADGSADAVWLDFIARLWPLMHRYRVLLALRRGEYGEQIHALLGPVDQTLVALVRKGQGAGVFGRHLPAQVLSQVAFSAVFAIADHNASGETISAGGAAITSLLMMGVPPAQAAALVESRSFPDRVSRPAD